MKAFLATSFFLLTSVAMGGSLYWVFQKAPQYQAESAQKMKEHFLAGGEISVQATDDQVWNFSGHAEDWVFALKGSLLEVRPPLPVATPALPASVSIQDLVVWPQIKASLQEVLRDRLQIPPNSSAQLEVLAPN